MQLSQTEENYLKAIYLLCETQETTPTTVLAQHLSTTPASVTDMIKRLHDKGWVVHIPYKGVSLTEKGSNYALQTIRKQRLWEYFLVNVLEFSWDSIQDLSEQLEHIEHPELISKLDAFLGHPSFDPHGDPIPDAQGVMPSRETFPLIQILPIQEVILAGLHEHTPDFLRFLDRLELKIGTRMKVIELIPFDESMVLQIGKREVILNKSITKNLLVLKHG